MMELNESPKSNFYAEDGKFAAGVHSAVELVCIYCFLVQHSNFIFYMGFASVFTCLGSEQAILTQQQQAIINQQAIILVSHMFLYNKSNMQ